MQKASSNPTPRKICSKFIPHPTAPAACKKCGAYREEHKDSK